jgi:hypothetical protein
VIRREVLQMTLECLCQVVAPGQKYSTCVTPYNQSDILFIRVLSMYLQNTSIRTSTVETTTYSTVAAGRESHKDYRLSSIFEHNDRTPIGLVAGGFVGVG